MYTFLLFTKNRKKILRHTPPHALSRSLVHGVRIWIPDSYRLKPAN